MWFGYFFLLGINDCVGQCRNGGICVDLLNDYKCNCFVGFIGKDCEINIDDCQFILCINSGVCKDGIQNYSCIC